MDATNYNRNYLVWAATSWLRWRSRLARRRHVVPGAALVQASFANQGTPRPTRSST